jgi:hypothetical protein
LQTLNRQNVVVLVHFKRVIPLVKLSFLDRFIKKLSNPPTNYTTIRHCSYTRP